MDAVVQLFGNNFELETIDTLLSRPQLLRLLLYILLLLPSDLLHAE